MTDPNPIDTLAGRIVAAIDQHIPGDLDPSTRMFRDGPFIAGDVTHIAHAIATGLTEQQQP